MGRIGGLWLAGVGGSTPWRVLGVVYVQSDNSFAGGPGFCPNFPPEGAIELLSTAPQTWLLGIRQVYRAVHRISPSSVIGMTMSSFFYSPQGKSCGNINNAWAQCIHKDSLLQFLLEYAI